MYFAQKLGAWFTENPKRSVFSLRCPCGHYWRQRAVVKDHTFCPACGEARGSASFTEIYIGPRMEA